MSHVFILYTHICRFSPGRSPISFDHEIVMMNHVYKERFPKVGTADTHFLSATSCLGHIWTHIFHLDQYK